MTPDALQDWLDAYVAAWRSYDAAAIGELFTEDACYAFHPWDRGDDVIRGRAAIVANWLEAPDEPGSWEAAYRPGLIDGDRATAVGVTRYLSDGKVFDNLWELRFAGGRCAEFVEWFMRRPKPRRG
jgi:ketosteroid isomerase-like protein